MRRKSLVKSIDVWARDQGFQVVGQHVSGLDIGHSVIYADYGPFTYRGETMMRFDLRVVHRDSVWCRGCDPIRYRDDFFFREILEWSWTAHLQSELLPCLETYALNEQGAIQSATEFLEMVSDEGRLLREMLMTNNKKWAVENIRLLRHINPHAAALWETAVERLPAVLRWKPEVAPVSRPHGLEVRDGLTAPLPKIPGIS